MDIRINRKAINHIFILFLALAFIIFLTFTAIAKSKTKYFIIDAELKTHLKDLARPILMKAGIPPETLKIFIIKDASIGAFVTPGMKLFIHTGLIMKTKTPSQLLGVLAHEIGHIAAGHLIRRREAIQDSQNISALGLVLGSLAAATTKSGEVATALAYGTQNASMASLLKFSRSQENAADQAAVNYLIATNTSPLGMLEFLKILEKEESLVVSRRSQYATTHPHTHDRINFVKNQLDLNQNLNSSLLPRKRDRHARILAKLIGFIQTPKETFRNYPKSDSTITAQYARAIALYKKADLVEAIKALDQLIQLEPKNPYFWELKGQVLLESNKRGMACDAFEKAYLYSGNPIILRQLAKAELLLDTPNSNSSALKHLEEAIRMTPESPPTWKQLAVAQGRNGKIALAQLSLAEEALLRKNFTRALKNALYAKKNLKRDIFAYQRALDIINYVKQARNFK